jgi:predicted outer membrane protein
MTPIRARFFVLALALVAATPAAAARDENWECSIKPLAELPDAQMYATVEIKDGFLRWTVADQRYQTLFFPISYQILDDNEAGIVAVKSGSPFVDANAGPILAAQVVLLRTSDGSVRQGNVGIKSGEFSEGHCTRVEKPKQP